MILVPEQIYNIREEERRNKETLNEYTDYLKYFKEEKTYDDISRLPIQDQTMNDSYSYEISKRNENYNALVNSFYLQNRNLEEIDIGTKFTMSLEIDGEEEIENHMMVEELIGVSSKEGYISKNSIVGKAIKGKKENETFSYNINNVKINGKILKIEKDPNAYMHFIRENKLSNRRSDKEKADLANIIALKDTSIEAKKEYEERFTITQSQKELLIYEKQFLENFKKKSRQVQTRLSIVNKKLEEKVASLPDNETIGIGSTFSILLFSNNETRSIRVEMINRAVSTELAADYVERMSPLGSKLFGLKNNDEFYLRDKDKNIISGIVFDIDNKKNRYETNSSLTYQKNK